MNKESMTKIVGTILIIMWVSRVPHLFPHPFQENKGIRDLATEFMQFPDGLKQASSVKAKTADELEKRMLIELRIHWIKGALFIVIGVLSGWLLIRRRIGGYLLAFFSSLLFIVIRFAPYLRHGKFTSTLETYKFLLRRYPVRTSHDILVYLILLGTVIFLMYIFFTRKRGHFISNPIRDRQKRKF